MKRGASSTDSAFRHNMDAELAHLLGESSLAVIMDLHMAFDSVLTGPLLEQARALEFPMQLVWQCWQQRRMVVASQKLRLQALIVYSIL